MLALDFAPLLFVRPVASLSEEFAGPSHWVRRLLGPARMAPLAALKYLYMEM